MEKIDVQLGSDSYAIHVSRSGDDWLSPLEGFLKDRAPVIMTNTKVRRLCARHLLKLRPKFLMLPDGERFKNLKTVDQAYRGLVRLGADRATPILLLGGGVLGDLGGFTAATYLRGLSFIHIGTTLVAQVDSSIGGKLGVDLPEGKNLVGVFRQPKAVLSHVPFLKTLPKREILGGLGEVLKYAIISDPTLLDLALPQREAILRGSEDVLYEIVRRSSAIKAQVVSADEKESSLRMILNFGHTFGHAIERLTHYRKYLHGEAIGIGMIIAARLSDSLGFCTTGDAKTVIQAVRQVGLPTEIPKFTDTQWTRALEVDKKSRGGKIHFVFMRKIGDVAVAPFAAADLVKEMKKC